MNNFILVDSFSPRSVHGAIGYKDMKLYDGKGFSVGQKISFLSISYLSSTFLMNSKSL